VRTEQRRRMHAPLPDQHRWLCSVLSEATIATTVCRATGMRWTVSTMKSVVAGFARFDAEASGGSRGTGSISGSRTFLFPVRASFTRGRLLLDDLDKPREEPSAGKPHARICGGEAEWPSYPTIPVPIRAGVIGDALVATRVESIPFVVEIR
jgi:hypothetical protein